MALNSSLFQSKRILEIGAGNALCGITVASSSASVTLSDFNEVVLSNIENIIALNCGDYHMTYCSGGSEKSCLGAENLNNIEVCPVTNILVPYGR